MPYSQQAFYGQTINNLTATKQLGNAAGGSFTSGTSAGWTTGAAFGPTVTFTSTTANTNVSDLVPATTGTAPDIIRRDATATTEKAVVTFKDLVNGETVQFAGFTFTATGNVSAVQLASAFKNITAATTSPTVAPNIRGGFTGENSGEWTSGAATGATVTFTSTSPGSDVPDLTGTVAAALDPEIATTNGSAEASSESYTVTFKNLTAGQTVSAAGLTFTAGTSGATAEQVANAFANINLTGATAAYLNSSPLTFASNYVVTPGVLTNTTSLSGYIAKPDDGNTYTFLATGTFTVTANSVANTKISAVKGSITSFKTFTNGALSDSITYGASVDNTLFGVTDSTVPITNAILTAQRSQAALQFNTFLGLLNSGATFIGSEDSIGGMDQVQGGTSMDRFTGNTGNDYFDGKAGIDTAIYRGNRADYFIGPISTLDRTDPAAANQIRAHTIIDSSLTGRDGIDTLVRVERLQFADTKVAIDLAPTQSAGQTALLLGAVLPGQLAFDVTKQALLGSVIGLFDQNFTLAQLSGAVLRLPIWEALTGIIAPTAADIATYLVHNVYAGTETAAITNAAITAMNSESGANQGTYLASLAASAANQTHIDLVGKQAIGLEYVA